MSKITWTALFYQIQAILIILNWFQPSLPVYDQIPTKIYNPNEGHTNSQDYEC